MTPRQLLLRLRASLRRCYSRKARIEAGILNGRYTINQGRRMMGMPEYTDPRDSFANSRVRVTGEGYWFLKEG